MLTAKQARDKSSEIAEYNKILLLNEAKKIRDNPPKYIAKIEQAIAKSVEEGLNFAFFSVMNDDICLVRVYFESLGYSIKNQSINTQQGTYTITW